MNNGAPDDDRNLRDSGDEWHFADRVFAQGIDLAPVRSGGSEPGPPPEEPKRPWYQRVSTWVIVVLVGVVLALLVPLLGSSDSGEDALPEAPETSVEATEEPDDEVTEPEPDPEDGDGGWSPLPDDWEWPWTDWEPPWQDWEWPWNREGWTWFWEEDGFTWPWERNGSDPPAEDGSTAPPDDTDPTDTDPTDTEPGDTDPGDDTDPADDAETAETP